nr:DEAD-box ATP-dependent RNA helicase 5 [Tanacetum cinerariifolium]
MPTINDSITKSEKKSKRKHQNPKPESQPAIESTKKDKKKKKKDELTNGSEVELTEKKMKKKKKQKTGQEPKKDEDVVAAVDVDEVRQSEDNVVVSGKDINDSKYKALTTFSESNLSDELLKCCKNFAKPSPM